MEVNPSFQFRLTAQAFHLLLDRGGGNLERDFSFIHAFEMNAWIFPYFFPYIPCLSDVLFFAIYDIY